MNSRLVPFLVPRLNGAKILVAGNHDKCWLKKDPSNRWHQHYLDAGFQSIEQSLRLEIADCQRRWRSLHYFERTS